MLGAIEINGEVALVEDLHGNVIKFGDCLEGDFIKIRTMCGCCKTYLCCYDVESGKKEWARNEGEFSVFKIRDITKDGKGEFDFYLDLVCFPDDLF